MNFWCALVFSREFRRPKGAKPKHIFEIWCWRVVSCAPLAVVFHRVHWVAGGRLLWLVLLSCRIPCPLPSFLLCLWCVTLEYGFISRFKGVLGGLGRSWGFVLLGCFAWLVWLLCACGVRRLYDLRRICPYFILFVLFLVLSFVLLLLLSLLVLLSYLFVGYCFLFPFGCIRKKKGRKGLSLASSLVLL